MTQETKDKLVIRLHTELEIPLTQALRLLNDADYDYSEAKEVYIELDESTSRTKKSLLKG